MTKRILYLEDLYDFYSNKYKRSTKFSAEKSGEPLVVQVHGRVNFDESDRNKDGLLPVHLQSCHTDLNVNGSNIDSSVMEAALPSFSNRPILGYIHKVTTDENPEGQWEFYSHNMHEDENGEVIYDEFPIGIIPESCNAQLVYDKEKKKTYCEVDGYIFEEYSKAAEILQREGECSVSVELSIRELSYDARQKFLNIEDFWFSGVTILGKTPQGDEVKPGMSGSNIKLADFSSKNNSLFSDYDSTLIDLQERLEKLESACFNNKNDISGKEETIEVEKEKFEEEVTETVEVTETEETTEEEVTVTENESEETVDETSEETTENAEENPVENTQDETETTDTNATENESVNPEKYSVTMSDGSVKEFSLSLDEITMSLYNLVNQMYGEADNAYYGVTVYKDNTLIMSDYWNGKYYRQSFNRDGDNFSLVGDRVAVHSVWVTDEEDASLNDMRSNYSSVVEELNTYKSAEVFADKMTVFDDEAYSEYLDTDEFKALMSEDSVNKYSKEELSEKADATLGKLVKKNKTFSFAGETPQKKYVSRVAFNAEKETEDTYKPYGDLFD